MSNSLNAWLVYLLMEFNSYHESALGPIYTDQFWNIVQP